MNELSREELEARRSRLDAVSRRNMERCAAFIAKMINKYGREVLAEIEAEEAASTTSAHSSDTCHASGYTEPQSANCSHDAENGRANNHCGDETE